MTCRVLGMGLAGFVAVAAAGCLGRSPDVRHYMLGLHELPTEASRAPEVAVLVGPVRLPAYLERPQLARLVPNGEVELDEFQRWLGGFDENFIRALTTGLTRQLGSIRVVGGPSKAPFPIDYRVRLHVDDMIVEAGGTLRVRIRWALIREGDGGEGGESALFLLDERLAGVGTSAEDVVRAHERVLADLATRIADAIAVRVADSEVGVGAGF